MVLGLAISAQSNIIFYGYILTIICMFTGSGPTRSTLPWYHRWIPYIWAVYIEGMRFPTAATFIVLWVSFSLFPFLEIELACCHLQNEPCNLELYALVGHTMHKDIYLGEEYYNLGTGPQNPSLCKTLPNILGFSIGLLGTFHNCDETSTMSQVVSTPSSSRIFRKFACLICCW